MIIEVVDPSGHGLGLAIGLLELGHGVHYVPCHSPRDLGSQMQRMRADVVDRMFGAPRAIKGDADLLVLIDVFADYLHCLDEGKGVVGEVAPSDPLQDNAGTVIYGKRLHYFCERIQAVPRVAVIDMSDHRAEREIAFEALPHAQLFAREARGSGEGAWRPFPFLYNLATLWLEYTRSQHEWLVVQDRLARWDWAFCGTVDHERYGHHRERVLAQMSERWPDLRGAVLSGKSFQEVLAVLQSVRFGLDLRGIGDLCFRLHECLALGTPLWRPVAAGVVLPAALRAVVVADPSDVPEVGVEQVRDVYAQHYAPRAAATWLLDSLQAGADQYSIHQATSMAPAASK